MNANAWTRLFISPLLVLLLASPLAGAAELGLDPRLLPGGEADLPALQQELTRLAAGRTAPSLVPAPPGGGARLPGLARLETSAFLIATNPFALEPLKGASRVLLIGPPGAVEPASEALAAEADARGIALVSLAVDPSRLPAGAELEGADAALLLALPEHDAPAQRRLLDKLAAAGVPGVALTDARHVERGALLSSPGALDLDAWRRRLALRLDDLAAGRPPNPSMTVPAGPRLAQPRDRRASRLGAQLHAAQPGASAGRDRCPEWGAACARRGGGPGARRQPGPGRFPPGGGGGRP